MSSSRAELAEQLAGRRILVTGATGFIGSHLCEALAALGAEVHGASRRADGVEVVGCVLHSVDLTDEQATARLFAELEPSAAYHLAGLVTGRPDIDLVGPMLANNVAATANVLLAAQRTGCERVVYGGSAEEPRPGDVAASPYAAAKAAGTLWARMFERVWRLPVAIVRPFLVYGPRQETSKLVPSVTLSLLRGEAADVRSPRRVCDFVFIGDVVSGLLLAGSRPDAIGRAVDLGTGTGTRISDLVRLLADLLGHELPFVEDTSNGDEELSSVADVETAREVLGWEAQWPLADGLKETIAWYETELRAGAFSAAR